MSMKMSTLIKRMQRALEEHGDLPVYAEGGDIREVVAHPTDDDGIVTHVDGVLVPPTCLTLEFVPS